MYTANDVAVACISQNCLTLEPLQYACAINVSAAFAYPHQPLDD